MTRVAWLNPEMWAELFIDNKDNLEKELDLMIGSLSEYKQAIHNSDSEALIKLLADGKRIKEEVDGSMTTVHITASLEYDVLIEHGIIDRAGELAGGGTAKEKPYA